MAIFTAINFLAVRLFAQVNNVITWWKVAIPVLTIIILFTKFHGGNFNPGGGGFNPFGWKAIFAAIPTAGIVFSYLGFEQADQLAGEIKNPGRNLPRAIIIAVLLGTVIYCLLQVVIIGATPSSLLTHGFQGIPSTNPVLIYPFAAVAGLAGFGFWATILHIDAFVSPFGTGLIYQTSTSRVGYGLARNQVLPAALPVGRPERRAVVQPDHGVRVRPVLPAAVPELEVAGRPGHRRERAHVRGRAAVPGRFPQEASRRGQALPDADRRVSCRRSPSSSPTCSSTGRASSWSGSSASAW